MEKKYPALIIDHSKIQDNMKTIKSWCDSANIDIAGVIKVSNGMVSIGEDFKASGAKWLASSRMEQLARMKAAGIDLPCLMIRVPMISELDELLEVCEYSLQSEIKTMRALNEKALAAGIVHNVIMMADVGDLREGFEFVEEMVPVAVEVENELKGLHLAGIGTNLGCTGSVKPTGEKMRELAAFAEKIEKAIGRELEIVSGGATSSLMPIFDNDMPSKINMLRIGELNFVGDMSDLLSAYGREEVKVLHGDAITLEAEVIEDKIKHSHPIGELGVDAFGNRPVYVDKGLRRRLLLGIGRADYGDIGDLEPMLEGAEVIGASGDHTIVDVTDCKTDIEVGDKIKFRLKYSAILNLTGSENVKKYEVR